MGWMKTFAIALHNRGCDKVADLPLMPEQQKATRDRGHGLTEVGWTCPECQAFLEQQFNSNATPENRWVWCRDCNLLWRG